MVDQHFRLASCNRIFGKVLHPIVPLDDTGNIFVTGNLNNYTTLYAYCTIKYNSYGVRQWAVNFYGSVSGGNYAYAIALDKFSNVYVSGYSNNPSNNFDYCTIKYNSNGVQQWVQYYDGPSHENDKVQKIAVDKVSESKSHPLSKKFPLGVPDTEKLQGFWA